jgi:hypothetical protein
VSEKQIRVSDIAQFLSKAAVLLRDSDAVLSFDPDRILRRAYNKTVGRLAFKAIRPLFLKRKRK